MLRRPGFAPHLRVDVLPDVGIQLSGERISIYLEGKAFIAVANGIQRGESWAVMLESAPDTDARDERSAALELLERQRLLCEHDEAPVTPARVYWSRRGSRARASFLTHAVSHVGTPRPELIRILDAALRAAGLSEPTDAASADVQLVLAEDYLEDSLATLNAQKLAAKKPWMLVRPCGIEPWIGPLFIPGKTGCWECLADRLRYNRPLHRLLPEAQENGYLQVPHGWLEATAEVATRAAAVELASYARARRTCLTGTVRSINTATWEIESHRLVRRPQCPACGAVIERPERVVLRSEPIAEDVEGYRARRPEAMLKDFEHHVSTITGVVPYLVAESKVTELGLHVYASGANSALPSITSRSGPRNRCGGKGKTDVQAKVGALAEALERYSMAMREGPAERKTRRLARYDELPAGTAIAPPELLHFSERQYADDALNKERFRRGSFHGVPLRWDSRTPITWTTGWSLRDDAVRYLPAKWCHTQDASLPDEPRYAFGDSNGFAAGTTLEDALLQGFFELVERDAVAIWFYNKVERPRVSLEALDNPYLRRVERVHHRFNRDFWIVDLTHDLRVPVYAALSQRRDESLKPHFYMGFGCHADATMAIERAASELVQLSGGLMGYDGDDPDRCGYDLANWFHGATRENQAFMLAEKRPPVMLPATASAATLREEVERCVRICAEHDMDFIVRDYTVPDIKLPVGRAIVPGMRHFWRRLAPGRLYDVPVALGWLPRTLREDEMNELSLPV